jgi:hypothetical protein
MANRKIDPELLDCTTWVTVDEKLLSEPNAVRFARISAAVRAACDGVKSAEIKRRFGVSRSMLHYYLARCTTEDSDGRLKGWRGLVPETHRKSYVRRASIQPSESCERLSISA